MKRFFLCVLIFALALTLIGCSGNNATDDSEEESEESLEEKLERQYETIRSLGIESIEVEVKSYSLWNDYEGTATISAKIPNYTELFTMAYGEEDMTKALYKEIKKKNYSTVECIGTAPIKVYGEEQILDSEEAVKTLVEKELIRAINAVLLLEEGEEVAE